MRRFILLALATVTLLLGLSTPAQASRLFLAPGWSISHPNCNQVIVQGTAQASQIIVDIYDPDSQYGNAIPVYANEVSGAFFVTQQVLNLTSCTQQPVIIITTATQPAVTLVYAWRFTVGSSASIKSVFVLPPNKGR
jgi:hypothetical protein